MRRSGKSYAAMLAKEAHLLANHSTKIVEQTKDGIVVTIKRGRILLQYNDKMGNSKVYIKVPGEYDKPIDFDHITGWIFQGSEIEGNGNTTFHFRVDFNDIRFNQNIEDVLSLFSLIYD